MPLRDGANCSQRSQSPLTGYQQASTHAMVELKSGTGSRRPCPQGVGFGRYLSSCVTQTEQERTNSDSGLRATGREGVAVYPLAQAFLHRYHETIYTVSDRADAG
ncbi:hypothetical protein Bphy_7240 (plasmid) [Paraburkholderia phymatum STM815]|uniref:Uncharacterized protein n=1 Tax=Paraburkholderia phymatum (strain DSM 17167 / CIP 108236 / LMG 21445 / STM815) TaxID=391038 RepID=B2JUR7_PARP8|nr:hypothetical protein Bphy_7240 [Paraburkholderia phymatum STM815]